MIGATIGFVEEVDVEQGEVVWGEYMFEVSTGYHTTTYAWQNDQLGSFRFMLGVIFL